VSTRGPAAVYARHQHGHCPSDPTGQSRPGVPLSGANRRNSNRHRRPTSDRPNPAELRPRSFDDPRNDTRDACVTLIDEHSDVDVAHGESKAAVGETPDRIHRDQTITKHRGGSLAGSLRDVPARCGIVGASQAGTAGCRRGHEVDVRALDDAAGQSSARGPIDAERQVPTRPPERTPQACQA
jgi:hypothetical protein